MPASINDKLTKASNGSMPLPTQLSAQKTVAAASLSLNASTGWPTSTAVHFSIYTVDAGGARVAGTQSLWKGILVGTTVSSLTLKGGTDQLYPAGSTVIPILTSAQWDELIEALSLEHNTDGTHGAVTATSVTSASLVSTGDIQHRSVSLETSRAEQIFDHIASGVVLSGTAYGSTLAWSITAGFVYINGRRLIVAAASGTVTASRDTYFDLLDPGSGPTATLVYTGGNSVTNNAASPALAANSVRAGIIVSAANIASVASVNQGQEDKVLPIASSVAYSVTDSLGNLICPRDPQRRVLGIRRTTANFASAATSATQITGLSCPVIVPTGRKVSVKVYGSNVYNSTAATDNIFTLWDGVVGAGTQLERGITTTPTANYRGQAFAETTVTPSSTSKTYNAGFHVSSGTGTIENSATAPGWIRVELA